MYTQYLICVRNIQNLINSISSSSLATLKPNSPAFLNGKLWFSFKCVKKISAQEFWTCILNRCNSYEGRPNYSDFKSFNPTVRYRRFVLRHIWLYDWFIPLYISHNSVTILFSPITKKKEWIMFAVLIA